MRFATTVIAAALLATTAPMVRAQGTGAETPRNVLQLSATGSVQVQQDLLVLTLATTKEGEDASAVQGQLQQVLDAALAEARRHAAPGQVDVRTGEFGIHPRHGKEGGITGWQGRAELVLSGRDFTRITRAAGQVRGMAVSQVAFDLSREARERTERQAQSEAIEAFKARAAELARDFGFAGYTLREVSVSSHEAAPGPRMLAMQAKGAAFEADAPVPVEAGKSQVVVTVSGSVQLQAAK